MAVKYKVLPRKNPQDAMAPEKFYAAAIADGDVDLDRLAELISYQCTVTASDCYAVLLSLEHNIIGELEQGRIVKLGRLGNFQVGLSSDGKVSEVIKDSNDDGRDDDVVPPSPTETLATLLPASNDLYFFASFLRFSFLFIEDAFAIS